MWCVTRLSVWCRITTSCVSEMTTDQACGDANRETRRFSELFRLLALRIRGSCLLMLALPSRPSTSACHREVPTALLRSSGCRSPSSAATIPSAGEWAAPVWTITVNVLSEWSGIFRSHRPWWNYLKNGNCSCCGRFRQGGWVCILRKSVVN